MTREEYLKQLIIEDSVTLKDFAKKIDMPYTTLYSILKNVGGAYDTLYEPLLHRTIEISYKISYCILDLFFINTI